MGGSMKIECNAALPMRARGKNARAHEQQRLLVGPWLHGLFNRVIGEVDAGRIWRSPLGSRT